MTTAYETDVLVIGGGPVGMALVLDLKYRGVGCQLIEASDGSVSHPRVGSIGPRSMELFRRWGIADRIRAAGWPGDHSLDTAWVTQVGGHEIHRLRVGTADTRPLPPYTPEPEQVCPQHWLAPLLLEEARTHPGGVVRTRCRLDGFTQHDDHVEATVTDLAEGRELRIRARYMVAVDGASSPVRKACGIPSSARYDVMTFRNILFRAPELRARLGQREAMFYFLMLSNQLRFPVRALDGRSLYRLTVSGTDADARDLVTMALAFETPVEILSDAVWHLTHRVAERFRQDRIFLLGDAAHTLSPSGGFGMNTGICAAADLGWKLAAELDGWAGRGLLDTYEEERRPVAVESLEEANLNLRRTMGRPVPPELHLDTPAGAEARARMARQLALSDVAREFDAPGIHFGFTYRSSLIVAEPEQAPVDPRKWQQSATPGARAPHAWLSPGASTLDLFGRGFTLLTFAEGAVGLEGVAGLERAFAERGVPLTTVRCDDRAVADLYEHPFVLVRPDGHVAWRAEAPPDDPGALADLVRGGRR
uniref:Putative FAD-monooxygenase n=1 Tax=Actinomadura melliaura TaxID=360723 RepID=Q0H2X3_9ACTN|nr:putative FAD-monooxygenase [Actinomadura melliaura]